MNGENPSRRAVCTGLAATVLFPAAASAASAKKTAASGGSTAKTGPHYPSLVGEIKHHFARKEDTLLDLARANNLGYVEMVAANPGLDPWVPGAGAEVILPTAHLLPDGPREGILLNLADQRLYFFPPGGKPIVTFAIGTGQEAWGTPHGSTTIVRKQRNPTWHVPKSIRKADPELPASIGPGPDNPLGHFAMHLGWPSYLIHGTNKPWGVGRRVSHGCIRLYPEGIAALFPRVPVGTHVTVVNQPIKIGWHDGDLLLEAHPNLEQNLQIEETGKFTPATVPELAYRISVAAGKKVDRVNWRTVEETVKSRHGYPVPILRDAEIGLDSAKRASES